MIQPVFKSKSGEKNANKQALQQEIEKNKERLDRAQQMMLDGEMEMADYKEIKRNIEPKIEALLNEQLGCNHAEVEFRGFLKKGLYAVKNLGYLFDRTEINGKQDILRSTLRENAVFSEGKCRTEKLNRLISMATYGDGQHSGDKKQKGSKICSLFVRVPLTSKIPNSLELGKGLKAIFELRKFIEI